MNYSSSTSLSGSDQRSDHSAIVRKSQQRGRTGMVLKRMVQCLFSVWVLPRYVVMTVMKSVTGHDAFRYASESIARVSGRRGVYLRQAFYRKTLAACGRDVYFGWNSAFSLTEAELGDRVYIGRFCSIGFARIESEAMLADQVQILSGGNEHKRDQKNAASMMHQDQVYRKVTIGKGAWIGAGAIVMADVGAGAIIGAGAVVSRPIPANCVAVGVPAKVVRHESVAVVTETA